MRNGTAAACHNFDSHHSRFTGETTMVAINRKRIHCVVIAVPVEADFFAERGALAHEMVPGADPYVAQLINGCKTKCVRNAGRNSSRNAPAGSPSKRGSTDADLVGDLELPWFDMPLEDEPLGEENIPGYGDN